MLRRVRIRNLRSLKDVTLEVGPLNVLVGPNGAGKSNILGAFEILREYTSRGQTALGDIAEAVGHLSHQGSRSPPPLSFEITGTIPDSMGTHRIFNYLLEISSPHASYTQVTREAFSYSDRTPLTLLESPGKPPNTGLVQIFNDDGTPLMAFSSGGMSALGMLAQQRAQEVESGLAKFAREILAWQLLSPAPHFSKQAEPAKREIRLNNEGTNLSSVLHSIYSEDYDAFSRIVNSLKAAVPEIKSVQVPVTSEGQTYVEVQENGARRPIPIWGLSDGTIALLQLFTLLENEKRPPLICIEEPENFVHPGLLEHVVDSLRRASETSQLLVTTHSPFLLDRLRPEDVLVVEKSGGDTKVGPAGDKSGIGEAVKKLTLGELWTSGAIGGTP
jgi:energy-coupling factor transporter ATP-binding protein EcfA2